MGEVAKSLIQGDSHAIGKGGPAVNLDCLLYFEPYAHLGEQILLELFSEEQPHCEKKVTDYFLYRIADRVHEKKEAFRKLLKPSATLLKERVSRAPPTYELVHIIQLWRDLDEQGSYQSLRKKLDQFSVFAGRNPIVSWLQ